MNKFAYKMERPKRIRSNEYANLPLPSRNSVWIQLSKLQMTKKCLDGSGRITVRTGINYLKSKFVESINRVSTLVIRGIIPQDDGVILPSRRFIVQNFNQLGQK